jgi:hypothetical protein
MCTGKQATPRRRGVATSALGSQGTARVEPVQQLGQILGIIKTRRRRIRDGCRRYILTCIGRFDPTFARVTAAPPLGLTCGRFSRGLSRAWLLYRIKLCLRQVARHSELVRSSVMNCSRIEISLGCQTARFTPRKTDQIAV